MPSVFFGDKPVAHPDENAAQPQPSLEKFISNRPIRRVVVETVMSAEGAFSSDELYQMTRRIRPSIGRATIYRTLRLLLEHRYVRETVLHGGQRVYQRSDDPRTILWVCDDCCNVHSLPPSEACDTLKSLAENHGLYPAEFTVEIHSRCEQMRRQGSCSNCR